MNLTLDTFVYGTGWACIIAGTFFLLTAAVGLWRMPDFFTRLHPAGVGDSMGVPLVLLGIALLHPFGLVTIKIILLMGFATYTAATACHALAKAALLDKKKPMAKIENRKKGR